MALHVFSVAEEMLVSVSVTSVIRLSLFVLRHNYPEHVFIREKSVFLWQEHGLMEMDYGGWGSHQLPSIQKLLLEGPEKN